MVIVIATKYTHFQKVPTISKIAMAIYFPLVNIFLVINSLMHWLQWPQQLLTLPQHPWEF